MALRFSGVHPVLFRFFLVIALCSFYVSSSGQNLLTNGDFELGNGVGFVSNYTFIPTPTGTTNAGQYGVGTNPQPYNTSSFISMGDHTTGTGRMMIVDGTNNSGNPEPFFWRVGTSGEICGLQVGVLYRFSYWIKSIYNPSIAGASVADVRIKWNNITAGEFITPSSGSTLAPAPGADWQKVTYTIIPTNACVRIEMYDLNGSFAGNDFAIDDIQLTPPPQPLSLTYSKRDVSCFGANNGSIVIYGVGGIAPYVTYSIGGAATQSNSTGIFTGLGPGTYSLFVIDGNGTTVTTSGIVITQPPNITITPSSATICAGTPVTLTAAGVSSYSWTATPADPTLTTPGAASITVTPTQTTTYTVSSASTTAQNLIFNGDFSSGNVGFITDYQYLMPNNPSGLQRAYGILPTPATWFPTFGACGDHTSGAGNMMVLDGSTFNGGNDRVWCQTVPVTPGQAYTFSYWVQSLVASNPANLEVTINGVSLGAPQLALATICNWVQRSFTWNSGAATTAVICIYNRNVSTAGNDFALDDLSFTTTITCNQSASATVTVNTGTVVTNFTYPSPVCAGTGTLNPVPAGGFTTGGTYSSTAGLVINSSTGVINLATSTPGTYSVTYAVAASGCSPAGSSNFSVTITPVVTPVTGFSYTSPVCANGTNPVPVPFAGFTSGGTYSAPAGLSINASTGVINLAASTPGTYLVTYTVAASGCNPLGSSTASITITPSVAPVTGFSYTSPVCANGTNPVPTIVTGFTPGGTYSSTTGLSINATTGIINLLSSIPGTYIVTYTVPASGCNPAGSSTASITITPSIFPVINFSYSTPVCTNGTNPVPVTVTGFTSGGTFSAPVGLSINATTGVINLAASTPGFYTVTYFVAASGCNPAATSSNSIVITPSVTPVTGFSYTSPVCASGTNPVPSTVAGFTAGGTYSAPAGLSINASTGVINLASSTPGTYTVTYTIAAVGCNPAGSSTASINITPSVAPVTGFSYTSPVCASGTNPVPATVAGFTTGGTYSAPAGLSINASTGVINLAGSTPGTYTVTYTRAAVGCNPAGSSTASITITPSVVPVTGFSYTSPVCANGTNPVPVTVSGFTTGGTFSAPAGLSINVSTGVINLAGSTAGTYTVTYTVAATGCSPSASSTFPITITPSIAPVTGFSYPSPVCANDVNPSPVVNSGFTPGGVFSSTSGLSVNASTGVINLAASTPGNYTITYTVAANGCNPARSSTATITINPSTTPVTGFSYPAASVCLNSTNPSPVPATGFVTGGTFSAPAGLSINPATGVINLAGSTPGSYTVTYSVTAAGCTLAGSSSAVIQVIALPAAPVVVTPVRYCVNATTLSLTATGSNLLWYTSATGGTGSTTAPRPSSSTAGVFSFYVSQRVNGCEGPRSMIEVVINPLPTADAGPDKQTLAGQPVQLTGVATGSNVTIQWTPPVNIQNPTSATPVVTPPVTTTYVMNVTSGDGCVARDQVLVVVLQELVIPNVFSPNGDSVNDKWIIKNIEQYPNNVVQIFNRYGQLLIETKGYSSSTAWDGTNKGNPLPVGAYYYIIRLNDGKGPLSGTISILR